MRLDVIGGLNVARPVLLIVGRNVFNPAVISNDYHVTVLKHALLDRATVHEGTVCTPEIYKLDTDRRIDN